MLHWYHHAGPGLESGQILHFKPPKSIPPHFPDWALWTTHRFHSESLDEKLESLEAEDLMSQPSHQRITWMMGGEKKGDKSHTARLRQRHCLRPTRDSILRPAPLLGIFPLHSGHPGMGREDSWETTVSAIHFGADISISKCAQVLWNPSCILFLALGWRAIYKSLTSPDLGSRNMKLNCADRYSRPTDRQPQLYAHGK